MTRQLTQIIKESKNKKKLRKIKKSKNLTVINRCKEKTIFGEKVRSRIVTGIASVELFRIILISKNCESTLTITVTNTKKCTLL